MLFESIDFPHQTHAHQFPRVSLLRDRLWNDFGFLTRYVATLYTSAEKTCVLGDLKILQRGRHDTQLPGEFETLTPEYASIGQSEGYYRSLKAQGALGDEVLRALRDITHPSLKRLDLNSLGDGLEQSLLRFPGARKAYARRHAPTHEALTFRYAHRFESFANAHEVEFEFDPQHPLSRINVLVGENASGKTSVLGRLAFALAGTPKNGELQPQKLGLAPILAVSFSPFDDFRRPDYTDTLYEYIGLRKHGPVGHDRSENERLQLDIEGAFGRLDRCAETIRSRGRVGEWRDVLEVCKLDSDLADATQLSSRMLQLSAGQKLAVFVLTNLVAKLESNAMVLFDEPELHTHPKMLSDLMRALSQLLHKYEAYAIIATHSPIVLQEVPARAIRVFSRRERDVEVHPYSSLHDEESFGAPLDQLVHQAFGQTRGERNFVHHVKKSAGEGTSALKSLESLLTGERSMTTRALLARHRESKK